MDDAAKLKTAMGLITTGLREKERGKKAEKYFYSKKLIHGINIFQSLNYKYNPEGFDFNELHEQAFLINYAMRPVDQWFEGWENTEALKLEEQPFYYLGALIGDSGFQTFHVNDDCEDYIEYFEKKLIEGIEQREVYDCLKVLSQEEYVVLRKYFIEHPIIRPQGLRMLKLDHTANEAALKAIENAYEEIFDDCYVCPRCGWTLYKEKVGMRCQSRTCIEANYIPGELERIPAGAGMLRLKRGVMKYIAVPGKLELEIYNYCNKHNVRSELWPQMDTYDIRITFSNGEVWAIDAKAVKEPYFLKEKICEDGGFPNGDYTRGFYVIPDEYADARPDYLDIINRELEKRGQTKVRCIRERDLKKEIRARG